jgi:hypothetical protein
MTKARRAVAGVAAGTLALFATSGASGAAQELPVRVSATVEDGVVRLGTSAGTQPLLGAWVDVKNGRACAGFSYQVPQCVDLPIDVGVQESIPDIATVDDDSSDGDVGVSAKVGRTPLVDIRYDVVGHRVCAAVGYGVPVCWQIPIP